MACKCDRSNYRILMYKHHHTRSNGTRSEKPLSSDYSYLKCTACGAYWHTKAKYVDGLSMADKGVCCDWRKPRKKVTLFR